MGADRQTKRRWALLLALAILAAVGWKAATTWSSLFSNTNAETSIEWARRNRQPVMLFFQRGTCELCPRVESLVQMVRPDYEPAILFVDVDADDPTNLNLVTQNQVHSVPTCVFVSVSGKSKQVAGLMTQTSLRAELDALLTQR